MMMDHFFTEKKHKTGKELRQSCRAVTLIEILVVMSLFLVLVGAGFSIFLTGVDSWQVNNVRTQLQQELRKGMDWMEEDLIQTGSTTITNVPADGSWYNTITFKKCNGTNNGSISWDANTTQFLLGAGTTQLQRRVGGQTQVIAQGIQSLQIRRQASAPNVVEIILQTQQSSVRGHVLTLSANLKVKVRN